MTTQSPGGVCARTVTPTRPGTIVTAATRVTGIQVFITAHDTARRVGCRSEGYTFELYALDTKLDVPQGTPQEAAVTRNAVINAMDGHVLGKAVLVARFHRP
jgi:hypothetical protein